MTKSKFHTDEDPQILGGMVQNLGNLTPEICVPQSYRFIHILTNQTWAL
jgi:hypothetical protein